MMPSFIQDNKVVAAAVGAISFLGILYVYRKTRPSAALPPGPPQAPVVGNLFQMPKERPWLKYAEWAEQYGDIVHVQVFNQHLIILSNYEDATRLMNEAKYSDRLQTVMLHELMGFNWGVSPMPYGPEWRRCRKLLHEQFNRHEVAQYAGQQEGSTRMMLRDLLSAPDDFNIHVQQWSARIIVDIGYGIDIGHDSSYVTLAQRVNGYFSLGVEPFRWLVDSFPFLKYVPDWMPGAHFKQVAKDARAACKQFLDEPFEEVEKRVAAGSARRSFVGNLIMQLDKSDPTYKQTEWSIKHTAAVFYAAGTDTTAITVVAAILYMILYPQAAVKAQAELDAVIGMNRLPVPGDRPELPHVTAFVMEVMRCFPVVPFGVPHLLNEADHYKGYVFPKGSLVVPNAWSMLRDSRVYVDPDSFNPDRFLVTKGRVSEVDPGDVGVFGFGRRKCPGQDLAELSTWLGVASILAAFDISAALDDNGKPIDVRYALSGITHLVTRPLPFPCSIKARSEQAASLVSAI